MSELMSQPTVGFQGVPGAYSESASIEAFAAAGVDEIQARGFHTFEDVFVALSKGAIDYAVLPVENTLGGSIHVNYDLLLRFHGAVHILGEYTLRVRHTLLALPGVQLNDIKKAMSHPQALAQTESYLRTAGIAPLVGYDTAGSAELVVQQGLRDTAAIASIHAAKACQRALALSVAAAAAAAAAAPPFGSARLCRASILVAVTSSCRLTSIGLFALG